MPAEKLYCQESLFEHVNKAIAAGDGMYAKGAEAHYFSVGASAIAAINESFTSARLGANSPARVLDYACGYGRVLRWLRAAFPESFLLGVDADRTAVATAGATLGIETRHLDISMKQLIDEPFDLIWVGSLLTHLPEEDSYRVLCFLRMHLTTKGVLVFTTHGAVVEERLVNGSRNYNLDSSGIRKLLSTLEATGFGYADYANQRDYGISVVRPSKVLSLVERANMKAIFFKDRGWADHQDVVACVQRPPLEASGS